MEETIDASISEMMEVRKMKIQYTTMSSRKTPQFISQPLNLVKLDNSTEYIKFSDVVLHCIKNDNYNYLSDKEMELFRECDVQDIRHLKGLYKDIGSDVTVRLTIDECLFKAIETLQYKLDVNNFNEVYNFDLSISRGFSSYKQAFADSYYKQYYNKKMYNIEGAFRMLGGYSITVLNNSRVDTIKSYISELVFKKEYLEYVIHCVLLDERICSDVFELWMDEEFDTPRTPYPRFRGGYRKHLLPEICESGIRFVNKTQEDFKQLEVKVKGPQFNSLGDYIKWLDTAALDLLNTLPKKEEVPSVYQMMA